MAWVIFDKEELIEIMNSGLDNPEYDPSLEELGLDPDRYEKIYYGDNNLAQDISIYGAKILQDPFTGNYIVEPDYPIPQKIRFIRLTTTAPDVNPENGRFEIPADGRSLAHLTVQLMVETEGGSGQYIEDIDPIPPYVDIENEIIKDVMDNTTSREFRTKWDRVIEDSETLFLNGEELSKDSYSIDYNTGDIYIKIRYLQPGDELKINYTTKRKKIRLKTTRGYLSDRWVITNNAGRAQFTLRSSQETVECDVSADTEGYGATEIYMEFIPI